MDYPKQSSNSESQSIDFYDFMLSVFPSNRFSVKQSNSKWNKMIWDEYRLWTLSSLCKFIQSKSCIQNMSLQSNSKLNIFEWFNHFIDFIQHVDETLLKQFSIIRNLNDDFVSSTKQKIAEGRNLTKIAINILKEF
jgi:hypothetical protein